MLNRGYERSFAESTFEQIKGFSEYGFPESHAANFALLVYAASWIKCHEPAAFLAALLNSQPLGFYSPSQLVQDAHRHGVVVRSVDVMHSDVDCTLKDLPGKPAVRLGLRLIGGLRTTSAARIQEERARAPFDNAEELARRCKLELHEMKLLAAADALASLSGHRREQVWEAAVGPPLLFSALVPILDRYQNAGIATSECTTVDRVVISIVQDFSAARHVAEIAQSHGPVQAACQLGDILGRNIVVSAYQLAVNADAQEQRGDALGHGPTGQTH